MNAALGYISFEAAALVYGIPITKRGPQLDLTVSEKPAAPLRLYRSALSGHCHRVELFLSLLGLRHELIDVNLGAGEHKRPEFLRLNDDGRLGFP